MFMAPENLDKDAVPVYSDRTDVWSVGAIMYLLLTKEAVFARCETYANLVHTATTK